MILNVCLYLSSYVGYEILKMLIDKNLYPAMVVIDPKDPVKYNERISELCFRKIPLFTYDEKVKEKLVEFKIDLICLLWWHYILKKEEFSIPTLGAINIHPSLLPYNKGKDPNFWAILNQVKAGVTIHKVTSAVDSGDIVVQREVKYDWLDNGETLYNKLLRESVMLFVDNAEGIFSGDVRATKQEDIFEDTKKRSNLTASYEIKLDEKTTARKVLNLIRAKQFYTFPSAYFVDDGKKYEVTIQITEAK